MCHFIFKNSMKYFSLKKITEIIKMCIQVHYPGFVLHL